MELNKGIRLKTAVLLFILTTVNVTASQAQTFAEWFSQGKTQIKYLTQQIAALTACEQSLKQGYNMAKSEWGSIGNFKNGEFLLHQSYYTSLSQVNPLVKNSTDIANIQSEQQSIISQFNAINNLSGLSAPEQSYITSVQQNVISQCAKDLDDLQTVLTPGKLVMSDDERIKRIRQLEEAIKDKYLFTCSFAGQARLLAIQRAQDNQSITTLNQLYGLH